MPIASAAAAAPSSTTRFWGAFISYNSLSLSSTFTLPTHKHHTFCCAIKTGSQESYGSDLLRKPIVSETHAGGNGRPPYHDSVESPSGFDSEGDAENLVDWEDQILEDTVPLVGFVRMILHSNRYQSGDRLSPEHERTILERLLPYHPEYDKKIGCGIDYITIGYHPQFEESRCLFIVRKNKEFVDFSYWKCIKGFIRKNYPLYADTFILKHFRRRRRD